MPKKKKVEKKPKKQPETQSVPFDDIMTRIAKVPPMPNENKAKKK